MNFLVFIFALFLMLSVFFFHLTHETHETKMLAESYIVHARGYNQLVNQEIEKQFRRECPPSENRKGKSDPCMTKDNKILSSHAYFRRKTIDRLEGAINLYCLIREANPFLYEKVNLYLKKIYGHMLAFRENPSLLSKLLDQLIDFQKNHFASQAKCSSLDAIEFKDDDLQWIYYQLTHGTQTYDIFKHQGYPPLIHCVTFIENTSPPISFPFANPILLEVIFGKGVQESIEAIELKKQSDQTKSPSLFALKQEELEDLVFQTQYIDDKNLVMGLFEFGSYRHKKEDSSLSYTDKHTNITLRLPKIRGT